jgi:hypothetical protein
MTELLPADGPAPALNLHVFNHTTGNWVIDRGGWVFGTGCSGDWRFNTRVGAPGKAKALGYR